VTVEREAAARAEIAELITRFASYGDRGRVHELGELFAPDAEFIVDGAGTYRGPDGVRARIHETMAIVAGAGDDKPVFRHHLATMQIQLEAEGRATATTYYTVLSRAGIDHWGVYLDRLARHEERWWFTRRRVVVDGLAPDSPFREVVGDPSQQSDRPLRGHGLTQGPGPARAPCGGSAETTYAARPARVWARPGRAHGAVVRGAPTSRNVPRERDGDFQGPISQPDSR
jgi:hypothetical protein